MLPRAVAISVVATLVLVASVVPAHAQGCLEPDQDGLGIDVPNREVPHPEDPREPAVISPGVVAAALAAIDQTPRLSRPRPASGPRGATVVLGSLYASTAVLQALDVHSTLRGLNRGAVELNPLMRDLVKNRPAFIATKALVGTGTILAARELGKRNKVAAVVALVALNSMYGAVVRNNYRVAR
jgi:hypothetical protein